MAHHGVAHLGAPRLLHVVAGLVVAEPLVPDPRAAGHRRLELDRGLPLAVDVVPNELPVGDVGADGPLAARRPEVVEVGPVLQPRRRRHVVRPDVHLHPGLEHPVADGAANRPREAEAAQAQRGLRRGQQRPQQPHGAYRAAKELDTPPRLCFYSYVYNTPHAAR